MGDRTCQPAGVRLAPDASRHGGFTLIEVLIYAGILAILTLPISSVVMVSIRSTRENDALNRVAERNRVAVNRVAQELRPALRDTVTITNSNRHLTLTLPDGFDGTNVVPGAQVRFELEMATGEQQNGADDNGNGLVDEGQLQRRDLGTGEVVSICQDLDLSQSRFEFSGASVVVTVATAGRSGHGTNVHVLARSATVTPRN